MPTAHLTARVLPQELAPGERVGFAGCPGFQGPVPQPVSMSAAKS